MSNPSIGEITKQQQASLTRNVSTRSKFEEALVEDISQFYADPYGYVMYAFPWGQDGTDLENETGPDAWQREQLMRVGQAFIDDPETTIQEATASGHGIGKSAEVAWIVMWAMSTRPHLAGWVTANTLNQLTKKTWRELAVWHKRAINAHWFEWTATRFQAVGHEETWGIDALPWTEHNSESFAGLHAQHVLMIMDEASGISDKIHEVAEGALTTTRAMWFQFGNPTRNTGAFRKCFGQLRHRWVTRNIDSRSCKMTNKVQIDKWKEDYGEDSDFFRVRVRGEFPHRATNQLIGSDRVNTARKTTLDESAYIYSPLHLGVDVARFGDDESVISAVQGRKQRSMKSYRGLDNMQVAAQAARIYREYQDTGVTMGAIYVDGIGTGSGVVDRLKELGYPVIDVNVGKAAEDSQLFFNKRAEIWYRLGEWLDGADIIDDADLGDQLTNTQYDMSTKEEKIKLESKADMKKRGLSSPDRAESLALVHSEVYMPMDRSAQINSFEPEVA